MLNRNYCSIRLHFL